MSRLWGSINEFTLPERMREPVLNWYIRSFGVNMDEAAIKDLKYYRNLGEFFRRRLTPFCRAIDKDSCLVSPSDGKVLYFGRLEEGNLEQVKGVTYSLSQFLGPHSWPSHNNQFQYNSHGDCSHTESTYSACIQHAQHKALFYCTIYLAPGDYHGFHSPTEWIVSMRRHFGGELLSVNPGVARWVRGLFYLNERAVYVGEWAHGFFAMAPVGATNVGSIKIYHDQNLLTNARKGKHDTGYRDEVFLHKDIGGLSLKKGEPFGEFNLGSSIVLIFEAPDTFKFNIESGQKIKFGQSLGYFGNKNINEAS